MKYGYFITWKLQKHFIQRVNKCYFWVWRKIISLTKVHRNCKRSDDLNKTSQESISSVRASHFIMAGNQILHSVYLFSKLHGGGWRKLDWTYWQNCKMFTNLSILFHCQSEIYIRIQIPKQSKMRWCYVISDIFYLITKVPSWSDRMVVGFITTYAISAYHH
jgi:hypothetical protein